MRAQTHFDIDDKLLAYGLRRTTKFGGIGKSIGGNIYIHRRYQQTLPKMELTAHTMYLSPDSPYCVVKYNTREGTFSFIESDDFDTAPEPQVGYVSLVRIGYHTVVKIIKPRSQIYHHKWQFVADDYNGFDVMESKLRSLSWVGLKGVDRSRIGQKAYWETNVVPRIGRLG